MPRTDRMRRRLLRAAFAAPAVVALPALAQGAFPARPIRLICPWPAGGSTDAVMRSLAESAGKALGGQVIVENKAGASGMLGPNELVTAKPDGYTLSQLTIGIARLPHMQKMQFDPLKDFTYVACLTGYTFGLRFERHAHGAGAEHYAHEDERGVLELYPSTSPAPGDATGLGFAVGDLEATSRQLAAALHAPGPIRDNPWGRSFVVRDPDGRRVEVTQAPQPRRA